MWIVFLGFLSGCYSFFFGTTAPERLHLRVVEWVVSSESTQSLGLSSFCRKFCFFGSSNLHPETITTSARYSRRCCFKMLLFYIACNLLLQEANTKTSLLETCAFVETAKKCPVSSSRNRRGLIWWLSCRCGASAVCGLRPAVRSP